MRAAALYLACSCAPAAAPILVLEPPPQPLADPRWFCGALLRGDLLAAGDAAAAWIAKTGNASFGADSFVARRLLGWVEAQPCVAHVEVNACAGPRLDIELRAAPPMTAYVRGVGTVVVVAGTSGDCPGSE